MSRAFRNLGRVVRNAVAEGVDQLDTHSRFYPQQTQQVPRYDVYPYQGYYNNNNSNMNPNLYTHFPPPYQQQVQEPPPSWPLLVNADKKTPTPTFACLLDAIFALAQSADTVTLSRDLLTPTRLAAVYEELSYPPQDNLPILLFRDAQASGDSNKTRVNEGMQLAWRIFGLDYTTTTSGEEGRGVAGLTRQGFHAMMVRDAVIYPHRQAVAYNALLRKHMGRLCALAGCEFPVGEIGAECFTPEGMLVTGDIETKRDYKERQELWVREYRARFPPVQCREGVGLPGNLQESAEGWALAMQLQTFKNDMTMGSLTPGYAVPNGWGGDSYYYTGGFNW